MKELETLDITNLIKNRKIKLKIIIKEEKVYMHQVLILKYLK